MAVGRLRTGVILILIGVLLLLNTTGVLSFRVWEAFVVLWPLLLIAIGIEKIFGATENLKPLAYLSPIIIVATVAYAVIGNPRSDLFSGTWEINGDDEQQVSVSGSGDINAVTLNMDFGGGRLKLRGGVSGGQILEGQLYTRGDRVSVESESRDGRMEVTLSPGSGSHRHFSFGDSDRERWILKVNDSLPLDLNVDAGAAQVRLDLEDLIVEKLNLQTGAADVDIAFGNRSARIDCEIDCGAASIDMVIPAGAGLRLKRESAMSSFSTGSIDLTERDGLLESPDFDTRAVQIYLDVESGVSKFRIREAGGQGTGSAI
ncbi:MAG: DUF5668 domain-containing protein [Candidatus Zixiibacteriota bacterium]